MIMGIEIPLLTALNIKIKFQCPANIDACTTPEHANDYVTDYHPRYPLPILL